MAIPFFLSEFKSGIQRVSLNLYLLSSKLSLEKYFSMNSPTFRSRHGDDYEGAFMVRDSSVTNTRINSVMGSVNQIKISVFRSFVRAYC